MNISTEPTVEPANVVNWSDDGSHYFIPQDVNAFGQLKGKTLYWRLAPDCDGERVWTPIQSFIVDEISVDPYYNLLHIAWPTADPAWNPDDLSSINSSILKSYKSQVGSAGLSPDRKLGYSFHIPFFLWNNIEHSKELLKRVLQATEEAELPVLIGLDGYEWWSGRPDLWNWWDPNKPGYNPDNKLNVEWFSWNSQDAVRDGGIRNWGSPFPMSEPHPNLTSPKVIEATKQALRELVPIINEWFKRLSPEKKYLFAGIKVGWEISIGVNYNYGRQIGYAAVSTAGIRNSGQLTRQDLTRAVQIYLTELARTIFDMGIPRRKILTHVGVGPSTCTAEAALNSYAIPGWSFYGPVEGLDEALDQIRSSGWGNAEWGDAVTNWKDAFHIFETKRNNKLVNNFSFHAQLPNDFAKGLGSVIDKISFWMHPPLLSSEIVGNRATLNWAIPSQATEVYLNVTRKPELGVDGGFQVVDVANERVTGTYRKEIIDLTPGTYYWQIISDGHERRMASDIGIFHIN
ncbi:hypothetical protein LJK88_21790 [Paenibacillus sp. P26]|nr:hypothetical protein LJK88_21790 [Paenibacillus sp. P26]